MAISQERAFRPHVVPTYTSTTPSGKRCLFKEEDNPKKINITISADHTAQRNNPSYIYNYT